MKNKKRVFFKLFIIIISVFITMTELPLIISPVKASDLAEYEQENYLHNGPSPMDAEPENVTLTTLENSSLRNDNYTLSLDGTWEMTNKGEISSLIEGKGWNGAFNATVPGSIYTALYNAGKISDPYDGTNMKGANKYSGWDWYFRKVFDYEGAGDKVELAFDGVCNLADIYLNGELIATHEGMFGGPYVDVTDKIVKGENTLIVHLYPAIDYKKTVVFNSSYGWHYSYLYPLGVWQSVTVKDIPTVKLESPFIATNDYERGTVDLAIALEGDTDIEGKLTVVISPKNFEGKASYFERNVKLDSAEATLRYRCNVPDHKLWWPLGYGEQNLYTLEVLFEAKDGTSSYYSAQFGIRELDFAPMPDGEKENTYNRTIVINGTPIYLKGAGWCTIDSMMRFEREDYDRILSRAHDAGINFLRSWGGGLVETDEFYDLCDEYGICVYQEWPCAWDTQRTQPADILYETVILNTKRLRNRASLIIWGGGNEGDGSFEDETLNNMGKLTYEYDGTRDFWRQDCGTGGKNMHHDHIHWSGESPEFYLSAYSEAKNFNLHEYGLDCLMNLESIKKFATEEEIAEWPIEPKSAVAYHTATFNFGGIWQMSSPNGYDIDTYTHYSDMFIKAESLSELILGSQMAQAQADYLPAINARINFPYNTTNIVYKLNDNFPGGSWSIVDWYGSPKIAYYLMQDAYRPLMAAVKLDKYNTSYEATPKALTLPVYLLDDVKALGTNTNWEVTVTAYNGKLEIIKSQSYVGNGVGSTVNLTGEFTLSAEQTATCPLIIVTDLAVDGKFYNRTYAYLNFEQTQGSLFYLPRTTLEYEVTGNICKITNTGKVAAVGVNILCPSSSDTFVCEDNYIFLAAGESTEITVNDGEKVEGVSCFNLRDTDDVSPPSAPTDISISAEGTDSASLSWTRADDDKALYGYNIYLEDGQGNKLSFFSDGKKTNYTLRGLADGTEYSVIIEAVDNNYNLSEKVYGGSFKTLTDTTLPSVLSAEFDGDGNIIVTFSREMDKSSAEDTTNYIINGGASIVSASLSEDKLNVILTLKETKNNNIYILGIVGVKDTKANKNSLEYHRVILDKSVSIAVSFDKEEGLEGITSAITLSERGKIDKALDSSLGGSAKLENISYTFSEGKTISFWAKGTVSDTYNVMLAKGPKTAGHFEFYVYKGNLWFYAPEMSGYDLGVSYNSLNGWHLFTFVWENREIKTYVDGVLESSTPVSGSVRELTEALAFGSLADGTLDFEGLLDEFRFYDRVLTDSEIAQAYDISSKLFFSNGKIELYVGESKKVGLRVYEDITYSFTVKGSSVTVSDDGVLTAVDTGESIIYAISDDREQFAALTVNVYSLPQETETETETITEEGTTETILENDTVTEISDDTTNTEKNTEDTDNELTANTEKQEDIPSGCKGSLSFFPAILTFIAALLAMVFKKRKTII